MKLAVLLLTVPVLLLGCLTAGESLPEGSGARTHLSEAFTFRPGMRVAVLPFTVTGHLERGEDFSAADIFSVKLAEAGFVIIDSTIFHRHDLELDALIPAGNLAAIRRQLSVELIAIGTINYRNDAGSRSLLGGGRYFADSASVRLVSLYTGQVVVITTARAVEGALAAAMGENIKQALERQ